MSKHYKPSGGTPTAAAAAAEVHPRERERVAQLIAVKKTDIALDTAKEIHKRCRNPESEALLLDTYGARVASLVERKLDREAEALMALVRERYPAAGERLRDWQTAFAARRGDINALLQPLSDASLAPEKQAAIAGMIRRDVFDLRALAETPVLAPQHPLRLAAGALYRAFEAVTTGPFAEEALALPEVSRSSPLAPWKLLVRAIAAYYRHDDVLCEKCLAAIDADSAPSRLVPPLRAMIHQPQNLTKPAAALVEQTRGGSDSLQAALKELDAALDRRNPGLVHQEIRNAVAACGAAEPGLLERLKQHISVRAVLAGVKSSKAAAAMGGSTLKDAHFWRLLARAHEEQKGEILLVGQACAAWEEFRKHAIRERWFPAAGPEVAALYLRMSDLLTRIPPEKLARLRLVFERNFDCFKDYYRDQPAVLRALMPSRGNVSFVDPALLLERACEADPCRENFERWLRHTRETEPKKCDSVAEHWSEALPHDIPPLLHLMQSAEQRNALQKAFKFMQRAEEIDGLNPEVRRARLRLLVAMAIRHLREKKPRLAEKDLHQIEALPQAQQGDRPAFVAALRYVWGLASGAKREADAAYAEGVRFLGDASTTQLLFLQVEMLCGRKSSSLPKSPRPTVPLFAAYGRVCALGDDMGIEIDLVSEVAGTLMNELSAPRISAEPRVLAALGEAAMRDDDLRLAYVIAGAGLMQGPESRARFLFLRARVLPPWEEERRSACLACASELARRQHDFDLLRQAGEWREELLGWMDVPEQARTAPDSAEIDRVVDLEIRTREFSFAPRGANNDNDYDEECPCPDCMAARGEIPKELAELIDKMGPEAVAKALAGVLGSGGKKKQRGRRAPLDDDDIPF